MAVQERAVSPDAAESFTPGQVEGPIAACPLLAAIGSPPLVRLPRGPGTGPW